MDNLTADLDDPVVGFPITLIEGVPARPVGVTGNCNMEALEACLLLGNDEVIVVVIGNDITRHIRLIFSLTMFTHDLLNMECLTDKEVTARQFLGVVATGAPLQQGGGDQRDQKQSQGNAHRRYGPIWAEPLMLIVYGDPSPA